MRIKVNKVMSIYQIVAKGDLDDVDQLRNIHHYEFPGYVPVTTELQEAVDALDAAYKTNLQARFVTGVNMEAYDVRRVDVGSLPAQQFVPTAGSWAGTNANVYLPPQVAAMLTFKAPTAFPRTSRCYLWVMGNDTNGSEGIISSSTLVSCLNFGNAIFTLAITAQPDAQKVSVKYSGIPRVVSASNVLTTVGIDNSWKTQRRRRRGVGE